MSVDSETHLRFGRLFSHGLSESLVSCQAAGDQHVFFGAYGAQQLQVPPNHG